MSVRSRVLLGCAAVALIAGVAGLVVGVLGDRIWQALPGLGVGVLVWCSYLLSRQQDRRDAGGHGRER